MITVDWRGWEVSRLCFGALPMGPAQKDLPPAEGARIIRRALELGVNFIDTAQAYRTYEHIRLALQGWHGRTYIATKSSAKIYEDMERAVQEALEALDVTAIDVFHLHAARADQDVFEARAGALQCLKDMKGRGIVSRIGIATHSARVADMAADRDDLDVVFPLINKSGLGILDGDREAMERAIARVHRSGKHLYAMKVFAGGNLLGDREAAMNYVLGVSGIEVVAVGMVSEFELMVNLDLVLGRRAGGEHWERTAGGEKALKILSLCSGCGSCLDACPNGALELVDGVCRVDRERCILCGYCAPGCPQFAIRVV